MPTTKSTKEKDACDLLDADHKAVKKLFNAYDELAGSKARGAAEKRLEIAREICTELTVHAQIEEEIFYPALRAALSETDMLAEAEVEHAGAKDLIAQIEALDQPDEMYDAKVKVLANTSTTTSRKSAMKSSRRRVLRASWTWWPCATSWRRARKP